MEKRLTLRDLANATGVPERTIRYYISRGILEPPIKRGPKAAYSEKHMQTLMNIKHLQEQGLTLSEIERLSVYGKPLEEKEDVYYQTMQKPLTRLTKSDMEVSKSGEIFEKTSTWHAYEVSKDIIVLVKSGVNPWRIKNIIDALKNI
ncbi:MAG: helix-turn-helix domain-containing protein [Fervidobacterium sp.]